MLYLSYPIQENMKKLALLATFGVDFDSSR